MRKDGRYFLPGLTAFLKLVLRSEAGEFGTLKLGNRLTLRDRLGHRLAVHFGQRRLVIEGFEMRRTTGHVEPDHALDLGREVRRIDHTFPALGLTLVSAQQTGIEKRS